MTQPLDRDPFPRGVTVGGVSVGLHPDRGVLLTLEHDDYAFSAEEARTLARALLHYADALDR